MAKEKLTENIAENTPIGGVLVGKRQGQTMIHNKGSLSGYLVGRTHAQGGIKAVNKSTGQPLEMQGGEVVITAPAVSDQTKREFEGKMMTNREILSEINSRGGGVSFANGGDIPEKLKYTGASYNYGGKVMSDHDIYMHINGGHLAKGKTLNQIAKMHNVELFDIEKQVKIGMKAESEHTSSKREQLKIVKDHLVENPEYYTLLKKAGLEKGGNIENEIKVGDLFIMSLPDIYRNENLGNKRQVAIVEKIENSKKITIYNGVVRFITDAENLLSKNKSSVAEVLKEFRNEKDKSVNRSVFDVISGLEKELISDKTLSLLKERYADSRIINPKYDFKDVDKKHLYSIQIVPNYTSQKSTWITKVDGYYLIHQINPKEDYYYIFDSIEDAINLKYGQPIYKKGGLIAPNGSKSNLTAEQYKLVRTPEFKAWFGDWENDPENASKVVDNNGEPLVVYHGTNSDFNAFELKTAGKRYNEENNTNTIEESGDYGMWGVGFYFSPIKNVSKAYGTKIMKLFLNIRNPFLRNPNLTGTNTQFQPARGRIASLNLREEILEKGYDGVIHIERSEKIPAPIMQIIAFEPNQIKLADGKNTQFDINNNDIRFNKGGEVKEDLAKDAKTGNTPARDLNNYNDVMDLEADGVVGGDSGLYANGGDLSELDKHFDLGGDISMPAVNSVKIVSSGDSLNNLIGNEYNSYVEFLESIQSAFTLLGKNVRSWVSLMAKDENGEKLIEVSTYISNQKNTNKNFNPFTGTYKNLEKPLANSRPISFKKYYWDNWLQSKVLPKVSSTTSTSSNTSSAPTNANAVDSLFSTEVPDTIPNFSGFAKDLPRAVLILAFKRAYEQGVEPKDVDLNRRVAGLGFAFADTEEGFSFWHDVSNGNLIQFKEKYGKYGEKLNDLVSAPTSSAKQTATKIDVPMTPEQELAKKYVADDFQLRKNDLIGSATKLEEARKDLVALSLLLPSFQASKFAVEKANILKEMSRLNKKITYEGFIRSNEEASKGDDLFTPQGLLDYYYTQTTQNPTAELEPACELPTPNGAKSKLPMGAYLNVRTSQFKKWFGDWEKAYETGNYVNCSKMIDEETKEPKIYFHGVKKYVPNFGQMSNMGVGVVRPYGSFEPPSFPASYFADNESYANFYGGIAENLPTPSPDYKPFIYKVFLSVKNPISLLPLDFEISYKDLMDYIFVVYGVKLKLNNALLGQLENDINKLHPIWVYIRRDIGLIETLKDYGYDALFQTGDIPVFDKNGNVVSDRSKFIKDTEYLTFYPNQVKSATVKKSFYFDFFNDIRFKKGGYVRI